MHESFWPKTLHIVFDVEKQVPWLLNSIYSIGYDSFFNFTLLVLVFQYRLCLSYFQKSVVAHMFLSVFGDNLSSLPDK